MLLEDALIETNPWWKGEFFNIDIKPRKIYQDLLAYLDKKQIIGIYGLRRTGKSYLAFYMIKKLIEKENPKTIFYFSFDEFSQTNISDVLKAAEQLTKTPIKFVFFDEIQKLDNWTEQIKRLYDFRNLKIILTGSETLMLRKSSKESLAGRIFEFKMNPLTFSEYLEFKGIENDSLHENEVKTAVEHYMLTSGFPELVNETEHLFIKKYVKEGILEKAIYKDIPKRYRIDDPSLLERMMNIITNNPGLLIDKNSFARDLGVFRQTISKYLFYLESSFLIRSLYNYSKNASTSEKKLKKYYPGFSPLAVELNHENEFIGKVVENICVLKSNAKFFWRSAQKDEIDIILENPVFPVEVKYRRQVSSGGIDKFMELFKVKDGLVITKDIEKTEGNKRYVPFWKWLLQS